MPVYVKMLIFLAPVVLMLINLAAYCLAIVTKSYHRALASAVPTLFIILLNFGKRRKGRGKLIALKENEKESGTQAGSGRIMRRAVSLSKCEVLPVV